VGSNNESQLLMRISLIDKHPILRKGLALLLDSYFLNVQLTESEDLTSYSECISKPGCDIVIIGLSNESLDIDFPLIKKVMLENPGTNFIIYAETAQRAVAVNSLIFGVKGYILKNCDLNEVVKCINAVNEGKWYISSEAIPSTMIQNQLAQVDPRTKSLRGLSGPDKSGITPV
jgi:DNA-binding NarL/FixJ family response regulator